jgi:hypothetical protein
LAIKQLMHALTEEAKTWPANHSTTFWPSHAAASSACLQRWQFAATNGGETNEHSNRFTHCRACPVLVRISLRSMVGNTRPASRRLARQLETLKHWRRQFRLRSNRVSFQTAGFCNGVGAP